MDPNTGVHASHLYSRGIIMNAQTRPKMTMFYFDSLDKIRDYDSFRVKAVYLSHSETQRNDGRPNFYSVIGHFRRSEEHTSELQSRPHLVCRLLLEKKK